MKVNLKDKNMKLFKDIISGLIMIIPVLIVLILVGLIAVTSIVTGSILWIFGLKEYTLGKPKVKISIKDKDEKDRKKISLSK